MKAIDEIRHYLKITVSPDTDWCTRRNLRIELINEHIPRLCDALEWLRMEHRAYIQRVLHGLDQKVIDATKKTIDDEISSILEVKNGKA